MSRKYKYTNEQLFKLATDWFSKNSNLPITTSFGRGMKTVIMNRFDTWNAYLTQAGLTPKEKTNCELRKICLTCKETFTTKTYTETNFCSKKCSNISRRKLEWKPPSGLNREEYLNKLREDIKKMPFESFGWEGRRKRVIEEQNNKCNKCGNDTWMGEPLVLEVDHINGNREDHSRENLEGLCPNCHSLTPTWRGKNLTRKILTDDELKIILESAPNICQGLTLAGMSPRGANYIRAKRLLEV